VRGLEAVTLCFPPTAGKHSKKKEKTIKQILNRKFLRKGYNVKYFMVEMFF
jgi:hypothetical protein